MSTIKMLENMIEYCSAKNKVISKNLANIGTEAYQRNEVLFKDVFTSQLNSNLKSTEKRHINSNPESFPGSNIEIVRDTSEDMISGINNVDVEREMADLAENTIQFKFAARKIGDYYKNLQKIIKGTAV